jgi:hypothetical protein
LKFYCNKAGRFVGDCILPYIDDTCLKYKLEEARKGYIKRKGADVKNLDDTFINDLEQKKKNKKKSFDYIPSRNFERRWGGGHKTLPFILEKKDKYIRFKSNQYYLCELIENSNMRNNPNSIINKTAKKTDSSCTDNSIRGWGQTLPYFITFLVHEYVWYRDTEINKLENEDNKKLKEVEEAKIIAEREATEAKEREIVALERMRKIEEDNQRLEIERKAAIEAKKATDRDALMIAEIASRLSEDKIVMEHKIENETIPANDEKNVKSGHCYCLYDPSRPSWRKIGTSEKSNKELLEQYKPRYFPIKPSITKWIPFTDNKFAENAVFKKLEKYRYNGTEWFNFESDTRSQDTIEKITEDAFADVIKFLG